MKKVVTFGELMMRLSPSNGLRFNQANSCDFFFGGSEANVAAALAQYGVPVAFVSKLPENAFGKAAVETLQRYGIDTSGIVCGGRRIGMYMTEKGLSPCSSVCTYDRAGSAFAEAGENDFDWEEIFAGAGWFHFSGIVPALGTNLERVCLTACMAAKKAGLTVSCDINYRSKLWKADYQGSDRNKQALDYASAVMCRLCQYADVLFVNEEEALVLGIPVTGEELTAASEFEDMACRLQQKFNCRIITSVARINGNSEVKAMLRENELISSASYPLHVIDPIGAGDAYAAALIYRLLQKPADKESVDFAAAACAVKHSIRGDFNLVSEAEIKSFSAASGVQR